MFFRRRYWLASTFAAAIAVIIAVLLSFSTAQAQTKTLRWHRWDADIQINRDGTFTVQETYEIEFIGGPFTFGYRNVPLDQFESLSGFSVWEGSTIYQESFNEAPNTFYVQENDGEYVVNWFFPSTSDSTRVFTVEYVVNGGIIIDEEVGDRFFWKAVGPDHAFPIESSTITVRMPEGTQLEVNPDVPSPYFYGVDAGYTVADNKSSVTYNTVNIPAGQYFEVGIRFPNGIVPNVKPSWQEAYEAEQTYNDTVRGPLNLGLAALAVLLLIGGLGGVYLLWLFAGRDPDIGPIPSYLTEPPSDLPPAIAGTLVDEKADLQDIISTVVDLARRGVIEMEEHENKILGITASRTFTFRRVPNSTESLRDFERQLVNDMFGTRNEIELDDLNQKFYTYIPTLQRKLYDDVVKEGLFPVSPKAIRGRYLGLGIAGLVLAVGTGFCAGTMIDRVDAILCPFIGAAVAAGALMIASGSMPVKTRRGAEEAAKWRAFKTYLQNTERFADLQNVTDQFERFLPYAIAFGLERSWINKFSRIPTTPMPGWYIPVGGRPYYTGGQSGGDSGRMMREAGNQGRDLRGEAVRPAPSLDNMNQGMMGGLNAMSAGLMTMLNSTASTFTSVPQSTSSGGGGGGFSGGGFSGGGGGGGGGAGFG